MIDVIQVLEAYGVQHRLGGKNVKSGDVGINCPLCGTDDSFHMGINLENGYWACWKDSSHRGKNLRWLFKHLLHASNEQLDAIFGQRVVSPLQKALERARAVSAAFDSQNKLQELRSERKWPSDFERIDADALRHRGLIRYLQKRHYREDSIGELVSRFDLRTGHGKWASRVVFPLYTNGDNGKAIRAGWTGRDITGLSDARYYTDAADYGKAVCHVRDFAETMLLVEGPFDALRINWTAYKHDYPIRAAAFLGTAVVEAQANILIPMFMGYGVQRTLVCMDAGAGHNAVAARRLLSILRPEMVSVPSAVKDPGEMNDKICRRWLRSLL